MRFLKTLLIATLLFGATACAVKLQPGETFTSRGEAFMVLQENRELILIRDQKSTEAGGIEGYVDEVIRVDCHAVEHGRVYMVPGVPNRAFQFECDGTVTYFISAGAAADAEPLPIKKSNIEPKPRTASPPMVDGR